MLGERAQGGGAPQDGARRVGGARVPREQQGTGDYDDAARGEDVQRPDAAGDLEWAEQQDAQAHRRNGRRRYRRQVVEEHSGGGQQGVDAVVEAGEGGQDLVEGGAMVAAGGVVVARGQGGSQLGQHAQAPRPAQQGVAVQGGGPEAGNCQEALSRVVGGPR